MTASAPSSPVAAVGLRAMTAGDIDAVVRLQMAFLEGSIITGLGRRFLTRFHALAIDHPATRAMVAETLDGVIAGFVLASTDVHAFNRHVKPRVLPRLVMALLSPRRIRIAGSICRGLADAEPQPDIPAELLLLVVDARYRRRGIGQRLVDALESTFRAEHVTRYRVAVRKHLAVARAFYENAGFEPEQELTVLGHPMTYLTKDIAR
jgi:ribosomal protein S18 acetylase RimI-like enzyme